jgi:phytoene dehydrogenase-like protein
VVAPMARGEHLEAEEAVSQANRYDVVVVGAGHNGLVAGGYLAKAGLRTLILERRESVGGAAALATTFGRLRGPVMRDLQLDRHGLRLVQPGVRVFAPQPDGRNLTLWGDPHRTAEELRAWSPADAEAFPRFDRKVRVLASFMAHIHAATPPDLKGGSAAALTGLKLARAFRRLGPKAGPEMLRNLPMAVADFVAEAFETDALRAAIAARGVQYTSKGPWSAGTVAVLLSDSVGTDRGAAGQSAFALGGPEKLADALRTAARQFGAVIRTGVEVNAIVSRDGRVAGVALDAGEEIEAGAVVSGMDPKRTLALCDPVALGPTLVWRAGNIRAPGSVGKVELTLDGLPSFNGAEPERLQGRIVVAPGIDDLERAFDASKYGRVSESPYLEATIPTLVDPSLAPEGRHAVHVLVQYAPFDLRDTTWEAEREGLGDLVLKTLERYAPGLSDRVVGRTVVTPADLELDYGLTGGHPYHAEPALDQFFAWRPLLGHAGYRFGLPGLYLCGSGAHPGGGVTGAPGANAARRVLADRGRR